MPVCFKISRYLTAKYFDMVWQAPQGGTLPKINFLNDKLKCQFFSYQQICNRIIFWHSLGASPPPSKWPPKNKFFNWLKLGIQFCLYNQVFKRQIFWHSLGIPTSGIPRMDPQQSIFKRLNLGCQFFYISIYLKDKYFDIVWGYYSWDPPKSIFKWLMLGR